jgi:hypothetical protein
MPSIYNETKTFTAQIPSGTNATSNPFSLGGYSKISVICPVMTSAYLSVAIAPSGSPTAGGMSATDGPYANVTDKLGLNISAITPGGTGGVAIDNSFFDAIKGHSGPVMLSASVAQTALRTFWVHLKA